jgi:hypothetical protein
MARPLSPWSPYTAKVRNLFARDDGTGILNAGIAAVGAALADGEDGVRFSKRCTKSRHGRGGVHANNAGQPDDWSHFWHEIRLSSFFSSRPDHHAHHPERGRPTAAPHAAAHAPRERASLQSLEAVWDVLNLLGQLSGTTTEIGDTKAAFASLTESLLHNLALTTYTGRVQELAAQAQVAIDILVRNLFERTADIGFLAMDDALRDFAAAARSGAAPGRAAMEARLQAYVRLYSVYRDVILVAPSGEIVARLPGGPQAGRMQDALLAEVLASDAPYVEATVCSDLFPGESRNLLYGTRVLAQDGAVLGALFLCFDFDNETGRIFEGLRRAGDWSVITLQDDAGRVIASSDLWQIAPGALVAAPDGDGHLVRFAGASYLASRHAAQGFQGYMGPPGWRALVLVPLAMAFEHDDEEDSGVAPADAPLVRAILRSGATFSPALQAMLSAGLSTSAGAFAMFIDADDNIIASTDASRAAGSKTGLPAALRAEALERGTAQLFAWEGQVVAAGAHGSPGYREYGGIEGRAGQRSLALVCVLLCADDGGADDARQEAPPAPVSSAAPVSMAAGPAIDIASFYGGHYLLGVPAACVAEAIAFGAVVRLPNAPDQVRGAIVYQGSTMLLFDLHKALGVAGRDRGRPGGRHCAHGQCVWQRHVDAGVGGDDAWRRQRADAGIAGGRQDRRDARPGAIAHIRCCARAFRVESGFPILKCPRHDLVVPSLRTGRPRHHGAGCIRRDGMADLRAWLAPGAGLVHAVRRRAGHCRALPDGVHRLGPGHRVAVIYRLLRTRHARRRSVSGGPVPAGPSNRRLVAARPGAGRRAAGCGGGRGTRAGRRPYAQRGGGRLPSGPGDRRAVHGACPRRSPRHAQALATAARLAGSGRPAAARRCARLAPVAHCGGPGAVRARPHVPARGVGACGGTVPAALRAGARALRLPVHLTY